MPTLQRGSRGPGPRPTASEVPRSRASRGASRQEHVLPRGGRGPQISVPSVGCCHRRTTQRAALPPVGRAWGRGHRTSWASARLPEGESRDVRAHSAFASSSSSWGVSQDGRNVGVWREVGGSLARVTREAKHGGRGDRGPFEAELRVVPLARGRGAWRDRGVDGRGCRAGPPRGIPGSPPPGCGAGSRSQPLLLVPECGHQGRRHREGGPHAPAESTRQSRSASWRPDPKSPALLGELGGTPRWPGGRRGSFPVPATATGSQSSFLSFGGQGGASLAGSRNWGHFVPSRHPRSLGPTPVPCEADRGAPGSPLGLTPVPSPESPSRSPLAEKGAPGSPRITSGLRAEGFAGTGRGDKSSFASGGQTRAPGRPWPAAVSWPCGVRTRDRGSDGRRLLWPRGFGSISLAARGASHLHGPQSSGSGCQHRRLWPAGHAEEQVFRIS